MNESKKYRYLFSGIMLKNLKVKNRIVFPPMVCFGFTDDNGFVGLQNIEHYRLRAESGAGVIITEATAVLKEGRTTNVQLGIWSDEHIAGHIEISSIVRGHGGVSILQLHHAGLITPIDVSKVAAGPSMEADKPNTREFSKEEAGEVAAAFIRGAARAREAGYDGIELHGAHGYLLNQFASTLWNHREDEFGGSLENRMRLASNIIKGIRTVCGQDFIIGYRMGANTPTLEDGIEAAGLLESQGVDYIHVSHGGNLKNLPRPPKEFEYNWIVYSASQVKKAVNIPVIAVNEIKTAGRADEIVAQGYADFVAIGRPQLADPFWVRNTEYGQEVNACLNCKPRCRWYESRELCPAYRRLNKKLTD